MDYFDELGVLALGSRLKRMSDRLVSEAHSVYRFYNLPVQPKWFPMLALLKSLEQVSVVQASDRLGISQPALSQFCKQLSEAGLVKIEKDDHDSRKRLVSFTPLGFVYVSNMQTIWKAVELAAEELSCEAMAICTANNFYDALVGLEKASKRSSLLERTQRALPDVAQSSEITFIPFSPSLTPFFDAINRQWIETMFAVEPIDDDVLTNPQARIIDQGGQIWFAKHPVFGIVGTCALLKTNEGEFELTKMGVLDIVRGLKVGEKLLSHVIEQAKNASTQYLYLLTNKRCEAAIHLYEKLGFEHCTQTLEKFGKHYERCDVAMRYEAK